MPYKDPAKNAEAQKRYRESHREKRRAQDRDYNARRKDKSRVYWQEYKARHPDLSDKHRLSQAAYTIRNPDTVVVNTQKRRARLMNASGNFTKQEWKELCDQYGNKCLACGQQAKLSPDHVIPISKGGTNDISNIQPLCLKCNLSKHNRIVDYRT